MRKTKVTKNLFDEIIAENLPALEKEIDIQVSMAIRTTNRHDQRRTCPWSWYS
jgi:hypothetical protein